jgi:DNA-binding transcriptional ArsR family regulator
MNFYHGVQTDKKAAEHTDKILKAMAHPVRLRIVELLQAREMCVNDIVEALPSKQAFTSQQLNMMKDKGILGRRRNGTRVYYQIKNERMTKLLYCINDRRRRKRD